MQILQVSFLRVSETETDICSYVGKNKWLPLVKNDEKGRPIFIRNCIFFSLSLSVFLSPGVLSDSGNQMNANDDDNNANDHNNNHYNSNQDPSST